MKKIHKEIQDFFKALSNDETITGFSMSTVIDGEKHEVKASKEEIDMIAGKKITTKGKK